jgi:hypothetical protein
MLVRLALLLTLLAGGNTAWLEEADLAVRLTVWELQGRPPGEPIKLPKDR